MIIIGIVGDIGSGKSYAARLFGYPVFNADKEVIKIYKKSKLCFRIKGWITKLYQVIPN